MKRMRPVGAFTPRLFAVPSDGRWISAGGVVFDRKGRIALVKQLDRTLRSRWTLPKGRLDAGESLEQAALREVYEESGLRARVAGYLGCHDGRRKRIHYFAMLLTADEGEHDDETEKVRFVKPAKARRLVRSQRDRAVLGWALAKGDRLLRARVRAAV